MPLEIERRLKCLALYREPPEGIEAAVARALARDPDQASASLVAVERVCFAAELGALRTERARLSADAPALPGPALRGLMEKLAGPLPERLRRFVVARAYASLAESVSWNLPEFELVALTPVLPLPDASGDGARLARMLAATLGAAVLAPPRAAAKLADRRDRMGYGAIVRFMTRTGAPVLPIDLAMKDEPSATPRVLRRRQEEMTSLIAQDLRIA